MTRRELNVETLSYVFPLVLPGPQKAVLLALAYLAPQDDGIAAVSHDDLAGITGLKPQRVRIGLLELIKEGLIEALGQVAANRPYIYKIVRDRRMEKLLGR